MHRLMKKMAAMALALVAVVSVGRAPAAAADMQAEGLAAVTAWVDAVTSNDRAALAAILAPEFQLVRENGAAYDRDEYLSRDLPDIAKAPPISDLVVTGDADVMVARYVLVIDATIDGARMQAKAPRLTVFRNIAGAWMVTAHANFATIGAK